MVTLIRGGAYIILTNIQKAQGPVDPKGPTVNRVSLLSKAQTGQQKYTLEKAISYALCIHK